MTSPSLPNIYYEGVVSVKRTFLWADRKLVIYSDRIELTHVDRPHTRKTVVEAANLTLAPVVRHHSVFEFTIFASQGGYIQRIRVRISDPVELDQVYLFLEKVKNSHVTRQRSFNANLKRSMSMKGHVNFDHPPHTSTSSLFELSPANPHMQINPVFAFLILFSAWIAPALNSWLLTISIVVSLGIAIAILISYYELTPPSIHIVLVWHQPLGRKNSLADSVHDHPPRKSSLASSLAESSPVRRSRSYIERQDFNVHSLDEVEGRSSSGRSSIHEEGSHILLSDSSKYLSRVASDLDYHTAYCVMRAAASAILTLLETQPEGLGPPANLLFLVPPKTESGEAFIPVVPDNLDCTRDEWAVIRNKNGIRILTSKLGPTMTRWPVVSAAGVVRASVDTVYRCVSTPEIFSNVDEFGGEFSVVDYAELAEAGGDHEALLDPLTAPFMIKYQEMKSVWPVQPRDYLAGLSGFAVHDGQGRKGKMLLSKSLDPHPKDPFIQGHEGFVRGSLTGSAFLILKNETNGDYSDVWTFLHCDMKGNLSGNGKIADFITQNQMPKFFAKLESVCAEMQEQHSHQT